MRGASANINTDYQEVFGADGPLGGLPGYDAILQAMTGLMSAAKEVREHGTFGYLDTTLATPDLNAFLRG